MRHFPSLFIGVACVCAASGCAHGARVMTSGPTSSQSMPSRSYGFDIWTGTFKIVGAVERFETTAGAYEYVTRPSVTLGLYQTRTPVTAARLTTAVFTASVIDDTNPPSHRRVLFRDKRTIHAEFERQGETELLPILRFALPKSIEMQAEYIELDFTDGRLVVPMGLNLKRGFR